jgi:hypothetical protein
MFRGKTCKHSVALALYAIRHPKAEVKDETQDETPRTLNLKLAKVRRTA